MEDRIRELGGTANTLDAESFKVAILGGGPGGMFTAWRFVAKAGPSRPITAFEAATSSGQAEIYDCSRPAARLAEAWEKMETSSLRRGQGLPRPGEPPWWESFVDIE